MRIMAIIKASQQARTDQTSLKSEQLDRVYSSKSYFLDGSSPSEQKRLPLDHSGSRVEFFLRNMDYPRKLTHEEIEAKASNQIHVPALCTHSRKLVGSDLKRRIESVASEFGLTDVDSNCVSILQLATETHLKNIVSNCVNTLREPTLTKRDLLLSCKLSPHTLIEDTELLEQDLCP